MPHTDTLSTLLNDLHPRLAEAERQREQQLAALPPSNGGNLVAEAHRASVERILREIRSAIERLEAGTYGDCARCSLPIPLVRLRRLLWTQRCVPCAAL